jgi:hypothetical protein
MKILRSMIARAGARLGRAGATGLALLILAAGFQAGTLYPEKKRLQALEREISELRQRATKFPADQERSPISSLAAFYAFFPTPQGLSEILDRLYGAAKRHSLVLERGEYKPAKSTVDGMQQYRVVFPVRGTYPQIRKFVDAALRDVPALSLESVHFERQKIADTSLDATVTLVVHLGSKP